jgi:hypothetical protein
MMASVGIAAAGSQAHGRQLGRAAQSEPGSRLGRGNRGAVGCTPAAKNAVREGETAPLPVATVPAATVIKAGGLTVTVAAAVALVHQPIIASACTGNTREAATARESMLSQAAEGDRIQGKVDIPAEAGTARPLAMGEARIIAVRTIAGRARVVIRKQRARE